MPGIEWVTPDGKPLASADLDEYASGRARPGRRSLVIGAILAVAVAVTGVVLAVDQPKQAPLAVTWNGTAVDAAQKTIDAADKLFRAYVRANGGASTKVSRCYFTRVNQASDDVAQALFCGPVLFADGRAPAVYLAYDTHPSVLPDQHVELTVKPTPLSPETVAAPTQTLLRPDHAQVQPLPAGFAAPAPLAAADRAVFTFDGGSLGDDFPVGPSGMSSSTLLIGLDGAAYVSHVGVGANERVAPSGSRLLALAVNAASAGTLGKNPDPGVGLQLDDGPVLPLPGLRIANFAPDTYFAVVVPGGTTSVRLVFDGAGFRQTLDLPSGKPGPDNILLYARSTPALSAQPVADRPEPIHVDSMGIRYDTTFDVPSTEPELLYFNTYGITPSARDRAFLHVGLCFLAPAQQGGSEDCVGFPASTMSLTYGGHRYLARNIGSAAGTDYAVFEVPVDFQDGTITVQGTYRDANLTVTVASPFQFRVSVSP